MASGEIDITPGRTLSPSERVDNSKLNDLGRPVLRVKEQSITSRELADGTITSDKLDVNLEAQLGVADGSVTTNKIVGAAVTNPKIADGAVDTAKLADGAVTAAKMVATLPIPPGAIMDFAGATAPAGWFFCGGQAISRTVYATLFAAIGTLWGAGDGSTTFNVPDLRGFVTAGRDDMVSGASGRLTSTYIPNGGGPTAIGGSGGVQSQVMTAAQMPSHAHAFTDYYGLFSGGGGNIQYGNDSKVQTTTLANSTAGAGSNAAQNNLQPTRIVNKIIRYL